MNEKNGINNDSDGNKKFGQFWVLNEQVFIIVIFICYSLLFIEMALINNYYLNLLKNYLLLLVSFFICRVYFIFHR